MLGAMSGDRPAASAFHVAVELGSEERPVLIRWSSRGRASYSLDAHQGRVLIDPDFPASVASDQLLAMVGGQPIATVLTNDWHERDAYRFRELCGTPVWAPAAGLPERGGELEGRPDYVYEEGASLPGGLRALAIRGA